MRRSVSPQAASTSSRTVWSRESPTMSDEDMIAEPIINPAMRSAAWRFFRRSCCQASRNASNRRGETMACTPNKLKRPNMRPPTNPFIDVKPSQMRMKYERIPSASGARTISARAPLEHPLRKPYAVTYAPTNRRSASSSTRSTTIPPRQHPQGNAHRTSVGWNHIAEQLTRRV